ncbi:P-loop containing nucleoside triphosphate hydrolase protein [Lentinus tigrinus ALCF2SS1-6]|uniref:P-loop containing nucleoside triphosphate hydrolase protein n=1 Tax=Lentinus tigrinus ALCF2SS1-6 TaxID=1328759 RepID=A0A5C2S9X3_9APHY|nr:P-loop containing nucleoside triphosphate hydrolase protein [Lentinus tigrinus ALCF2SS1-6]
MRLRFSRSRRVPSRSQNEKDIQETKPLNGESSEDLETVAAQPQVPVPPPNLKIKRVDHYWSSWSKGWKYRNTGSSVVAEAVRPVGNGTDNDPWQNFCFVVVRKLPDPRNADKPGPGGDIKFQIVVKSPYLLKACKDVVGTVPGISWTAEPLELDPHLLLAFFPQFEQYERALRSKTRTPEEEHVLATLTILLDYLRKDYRATLAKIASLKASGEITFELLYAILVPRTILITECPVTGEPRALQLLSANKIENSMCSLYSLLCENIDSTEEGAHPGRGDSASNPNSNAFADTHTFSPSPSSARERLAAFRAAKADNTDGNGPVAAPSGGGRSFGRVQSKVLLWSFKGTEKINSLEAYPIQYHRDPEAMKTLLLERGRKWASLKGIHHVHYEGTAAFAITAGGRKKIIKYNVNSRIMVDRGNFIRLNPNYEMPVPSTVNQQNQVEDLRDRRSYGLPPLRSNENMGDNVPTLDVSSKRKAAEDEVSLTDEELMLASPIVYGFSLSDKIWLEFNVENIKPIVWNDEAFQGLVLAADRKNLLRSLVDAHNADLGFDDFVQGKGQGLIINLFGPPGVGKTLSAEATSEHVHRPLYVVGGGDLGTKASKLDLSLERVFDIATSWKAIVLIDEADVFLERRSLHDLERNAMVAVFLRHVEYYRGILFLTTNRITSFDEAFLSRIHVALHFAELSTSAKAQVWRAFLHKAGVSSTDVGEDQVQQLAKREINGRQIKNACRTAQSLAHSRGEPLGFAHLTETLDAMEMFTAEFAALGRT